MKPVTHIKRVLETLFQKRLFKICFLNRYFIVVFTKGFS